MCEVKNLDNKRVCDISEDYKTIVIQKSKCITYIQINADGIVDISHEYVKTK